MIQRFNLVLFRTLQSIKINETLIFKKKTKKKLSFSKEKFFDQSKIKIKDVENKELLIFFEKTNNSKMILKKSLIEFNERLNEHFKKLIKRRLNES